MHCVNVIMANGHFFSGGKCGPDRVRVQSTRAQAKMTRATLRAANAHLAIGIVANGMSLTERRRHLSVRAIDQANDSSWPIVANPYAIDKSVARMAAHADV